MCNNHFPIEGHQTDPIEALRAKERERQKRIKAAGQGGVAAAIDADEASTEDRGILQPLAARVLMKILYAARMARFDLLRAVCNLACFVTR